MPTAPITILAVSLYSTMIAATLKTASERTWENALNIRDTMTASFILEVIADANWRCRGHTTSQAPHSRSRPQVVAAEVLLVLTVF